ncbi:MAG: RNA polymerase sigma factor [Opitutaceae bacterium]
MPPQIPEVARWFADEVQPHERSLRAYLHAAAPAAVEVDDLLQESYMRLLRARETAPIRCVKALLFAIARNAVRDVVRHKLANLEIPGAEIDSFPVLDDSAGVIDLVSRRQEQVLLADAIRALPERCREVLILRKIHGLPQKEIAARLGISENTVESLVSRAVRRCAKHIRQRVRTRQ